QERDGLQRLTEAHVVGEDAARADVVEEHEPREAALLIVAEARALEVARPRDDRDLRDVAELLEEGLGRGRDGRVADEAQEILDAAGLRERQLLAAADAGVDLGHALEDLRD